MKLEDCLKKTRTTLTIAAATTYAIMALGFAGCTPKNEDRSCKRPHHQDCYGLHIKQYSDHVGIELYKEGWQIAKENVDGVVNIRITENQIEYTSDGQTTKYDINFYENKNNGGN